MQDETRFLPDTGNDPCAVNKGFGTLKEAIAWVNQQAQENDICIWKRWYSGHESNYRIAAVRIEGNWVYPIIQDSVEIAFRPEILEGPKS